MAKYSKRADGRYQYQFRAGYDENGRRIIKSFYGRTVAELEAKIRNAKAEMARSSGSGFVVDYVDDFISTYKAARSENTRAMYERSLRYHIRPLFAGLRMRDLTPAEIQKAVNSLAGKRRTAEIMLSLLRQACDRASDSGIFAVNPCKWIELPSKTQKRERRAFGAQEKAAIMSAPFDERESCFVFLLYGCGLRREEVLGLRLCDVDLKRCDVSVRQTVVFPENAAVVRPCGKTDLSLRTVPLPASMLSRIEPWYNVRTLSGAAASDLLFPGFSKSVYVRFWRKIQEKLGIPDVTAYWFRHNYATQLYYSGVSIKQAGALLGHSGVQMILKIYAHLDAEKENARGKIDAIFC